VRPGDVIIELPAPGAAPAPRVSPPVLPRMPPPMPQMPETAPV
jgi:hypothetical protein